MASRFQRPDRESWKPNRDIDRDDTAPPERVSPDPADWGHTPESARTELERRMCPMCGEGPWKSPLNHVAKKHGIDRLTMRDACHMPTKVAVTAPELHEKFAERGRNADMTNLSAAVKKVDRSKARRTHAARAASGRNLAEWREANPDEQKRVWAGFQERVNTPEAKAKWAAEMERVRAERVYTDEERVAFAKLMASPEAVAKREEYNQQRRHVGCSVEGCEKEHVARGYCNVHWQHWKRYGDPLARGKIGKPPTLDEQQSEEALAMLRSGQTQRQVAEHFGTTQSTISRLVRGEWKR